MIKLYIYGKNVAREALEKNNIKEVYLYKRFNDKEILTKLLNKKIKINYVDKHELDMIEEGNHQGIILSVLDYKYESLNAVFNEEIVVILDHIEDPHNLGAIIRTCEAAGITSIIIPKDRSAKVNATVMKSSVGCLEKVKVVMVSNLNMSIDKLKEKGFWIIGTDMQGTDFKKIDYSGKIALIIGNEGKGINSLTKKKCDFIASIPMQGTVNSLNASVAAALVIYEAVRER